MWVALLAPLLFAVGSNAHGITILAQGRAFCGPYADDGYDMDLLGGRVRLCDNDQPERDDCSE
ncbi:hypothetical protein AAVH_07407 [Aphelenchoides avenae]|nr:hypothetical protein AAVH_07407 [Aphelenchus avenae]